MKYRLKTEHVMKRMLELDLTQSDLANSMHVPRQRVSTLLSGRNKPTLSTIIKLASALCVKEPMELVEVIQ